VKRADALLELANHVVKLSQRTLARVTYRSLEISHGGITITARLCGPSTLEGLASGCEHIAYIFCEMTNRSGAGKELGGRSGGHFTETGEDVGKLVVCGKGLGKQ
jgi:hypothetical protein